MPPEMSDSDTQSPKAFRPIARRPSGSVIDTRPLWANAYGAIESSREGNVSSFAGMAAKAPSPITSMSSGNSTLARGITAKAYGGMRAGSTVSLRISISSSIGMLSRSTASSEEYTLPSSTSTRVSEGTPPRADDSVPGVSDTTVRAIAPGMAANAAAAAIIVREKPSNILPINGINAC